MGCRCADKRKCLNDIKKIEKIRTLLMKDGVTNSAVSGEIQNLTNREIITFTATNMNELISEEKKLNEYITELLPRLIKQCTDKIEDLHCKYRAMTREDYDYHHRDDD